MRSLPLPSLATQIAAIPLFLAAIALNVHAETPNPERFCDRPARPTSDLVKQGVIYQIHLRAFTPEDSLKAASERLPKLAELGVDIVYLTPICVSDPDPDTKGWSKRQKKSKTNNPRNPYRMKDYYNVDPEYGTNDDLKEFVAAAHRLDMRVMLDVVFYHCGPNAVFIKDHPDFIKRDKDGNLDMKGSSYNFPLINHANPELREYLIKNLEYWVTEFDVDGFRADVARRIPIAFWDEARRRLDKIRPGIVLLAEGGYDSQFNAFDMNYPYAWVWSIHRVYRDKNPASNIRKNWEKLLPQYPGGARLIRFIDSHDIANDSYDNRLDKKWGTQVVDTGLVLNFTIDGVPFLYNGQEIADTARHSIMGLPGQMVIDWAKENTPEGQSRLALCKKLISLRHTEKALSHGSVHWLDNSAPAEVLSFLRTTDKEQILTVINLKKKAVNVEIDLPAEFEFRPLLERGVKEVSNKSGQKTFALDPCGFLVAKQKETAGK